MSIERHSATEIRNAGLNYISLPSQVVEALAITGGIEAVGLWAVMNNNATSFAIIKKVVCKKYGCSERLFTRCMTAMEKLELAWIEVAPRTKDGKLGGKNWCVSNLPKSVQEKLDSAVNAMCEMTGSVENTGDLPTPAKLKPRSPTPAKLPTSAENRPSVNCGDITKNESLTKYESTTAKITTDWQPSNDTIQMLNRRGVPAEFAQNYRDEFVTYWLANGKDRIEFDSLFIKQAVGQFEQRRKADSHSQTKSITKKTAVDVVRAWNNAMPEIKHQPINYTSSQLSTQIGWLWNAQPDNLKDPEFFEAVFEEMAKDDFLMRDTTTFTLANAIKQDKFAMFASRIIEEAA